MTCVGECEIMIDDELFVELVVEVVAISLFSINMFSMYLVTLSLRKGPPPLSVFSTSSVSAFTGTFAPFSVVAASSHVR